MTRRRSPSHRWELHGGYSLLRRVGAGTLDGRMREAVILRSVTRQLAADLGDSWERLPTGKRLLCEQAAVKAVILSLMGAWALSRPIIGKDGKLRPPLGHNYLAWSNSLRFDLLALGLERRQKSVLDLAALVASTAKAGAQRDGDG